MTIGYIVYGITVVVHDFWNVNFSYVRRNGNKHANFLAKHSYGIDDYCVWIEKNPFF